MSQQNESSITGTNQVSQNPLDENSSNAPGSGYKQSESSQPGETPKNSSLEQDQESEFANNDVESDSSDMDADFDEEEDDIA